MILIHNPLGIALLHILNDNEVMKITYDKVSYVFIFFHDEETRDGYTIY